MSKISIMISSIGVVALTILNRPHAIASENQKEDHEIAHQQMRAAWKNVEKYIEHRKDEDSDSLHIGLFPLYLLLRKSEGTNILFSALLSLWWLLHSWAI